MADIRRFYDDPGLAALDTTVVEAGETDGRPFVRLAETIFYPEGGGQPADHGRIGDAAVLDVQLVRGTVLHYTDRPLSEGRVSVALDTPRRFDHCQQHTAQHLLTAVLLDRHSLATTSFHLGTDITAIEVRGAAPSGADLATFEREVNLHLREDRRVRTRWIDAEDLAASGVRTRGLPEGHAGPVRLVEIEGLDLNTCGGTHVERLGEIQVIEVLDAEAARGGTRIRFLAGGRVLARSRRRRELEEALKQRLGTAPAEFASVIDKWCDELRAKERRIRDLEAERAERIAADISARPGPVLCAALPGSGPDVLRGTAARILALRPEAVVVLGGDTGDPREACFLVQSGPGGPEDVSSIGTRVRDLLGAKGGGRGRTFQGKGGRLPDEAALVRAASGLP